MQLRSRMVDSKRGKTALENAGDLAEIENNQDIAKVKVEWNCGDWLGHGEILQASALIWLKDILGNHCGRNMGLIRAARTHRSGNVKVVPFSPTSLIYVAQNDCTSCS